MNNLMGSVRKVLGGLLVTALVAGGLALTLPSTVFAASLGQGTTPPATEGQPAKNFQRLENAYQREMKWLDGQTARLAKTSEVMDKVAARIAELKAKNLDTSALEEALADYQSAVQSAQGFHDHAQAILSAHAGFDGGGKVTNAQQALTTVQDAGKALRDAHQELRPAIRDLLQALREFRRDNRPKP